MIGCGLGILVALVLARWRRLGRALMPYAIAASAIPIIAFAPITNAWFGPFGKTSKMAIAAVLCFFPVFVNTLRGLTSVRPASIELMRSYAAGEIDIFRRVRFPTALPFIFTALKIATVLAMIGAIVGEYFGGCSGRAGSPDQQPQRDLRLRGGVGRDRRRLRLRDRVLPRGRGTRAPGSTRRAIDRGLTIGQNRSHRVEAVKEGE